MYQEQAFDGQMNPGDVLSVRITVAGSKDWRYLMIEDPLPAGVEAIQDTTAYPMQREDRWRWWWGSQTEYRDNRTVFFQERFDGRAEFVYLVKAISSGEFRAMPAQVAPMYVPDVTASSEPQTVIVATPGRRLAVIARSLTARRSLAAAAPFARGTVLGAAEHARSQRLDARISQRCSSSRSSSALPVR